MLVTLSGTETLSSFSQYEKLTLPIVVRVLGNESVVISIAATSRQARNVLDFCFFILISLIKYSVSMITLFYRSFSLYIVDKKRQCNLADMTITVAYLFTCCSVFQLFFC